MYVQGEMRWPLAAATKRVRVSIHTADYQIPPTGRRLMMALASHY
jgi:hypothetical protein